MAGRTALITGAAVRIGRAIAESLAADGWAVAIHFNRSHKEANAVAAGIAERGGTAAIVDANLANLTALPGLIGKAAEALGPLELLVNNAATFEKDEIDILEPDTWRRQMDINAAAPTFLAQAFAAALPGHLTGNVVNIIDQRVWKPVPEFLSYQVSKSAAWAATIALAQALAPRIRVNAIAPGPVLPSPRQSQSDFDRQAATLPLGKGPALDDFGRTIRFLVETPSITGQMIALDGGQHLAWKTPDVGFPE